VMMRSSFRRTSTETDPDRPILLSLRTIHTQLQRMLTTHHTLNHTVLFQAAVIDRKRTNNNI
jgi:hypothetical protein